MPRVRRIVRPDVPLHMTQRGTNRFPTFLTDDDFAFYRAILEDASAESGCAVHAYALMTNHVHLLVTPREEDGPARMMCTINRRYVPYFNQRHRHSGALWGGRYSSAAVDDERYLLDAHRYIEANPARAGMVDDPGDYAWSSHRHNAFGEEDPVVRPHPLYLALGAGDDERRAAYRALFAAELSARALGHLRAALRARPKLATTPYHEAINAMIDSRRPTPLEH